MIDHPIKLVVFDLGGTVVDQGCMAPIVGMIEAFQRVGVTVTPQEARGPMGLYKLDHIRELLRLPNVSAQWQEHHGRPWGDDDVKHIYDLLVPLQVEVAVQHADLVTGVRDCYAWLRQNEVAIAATTGYPRSVAQPILDIAAQQGFQADTSACADEVHSGRPAPWMMFRVMEVLNVFPPSAVVKVGDTVFDMQAALNAGAWAVGVTETGSEIGLSHEELTALSQQERDERHRAAAAKLRDAGAHTVVRSPAELSTVLQPAR